MALTSSGGQWNTYGWQVDGTHPAGMLYCFVMRFLRVKGNLTAHTWGRLTSLVVHCSSRKTRLYKTVVQKQQELSTEGQIPACLNKIEQVWVGFWRWGPHMGRGPEGLQVNKFQHVYVVILGPPRGQTDRQTQLKTLPTRNYVGTRALGKTNRNWS